MSPVPFRSRLPLSRVSSLALMSVLLCCEAFGSGPPQNETDSLARKVDELFALLDKPDSPGCALAIVKDGRILYKRGYGMANLEHGVPISASTVMDTASISKQFTAMCVLLLAEQGKLTLDDDIRKYLPEMPRYENVITIRHLIHHTSGIREYVALMKLAGMRDDDYYTDGELLDMLARQKNLNFKPGDQFSYSNSGYFLLGQIVKRASGMTLREYADRNIFKPLGMNNTRFYDDHTELIKNRATGYAKKPKGFQTSVSTLDMVGDGNLFTTVEDLSLWDQNFYRNRLGNGGEALVRQALNTMTLNNGQKNDYAFGLIVGQYRGLKTVEHSGSFVGYRSHMLRFPDQRFSVICECNLASAEPFDLTRRAGDIYLADQFKQEAPKEVAPPPALKFIELPEAELKDKARAYINPANGVILKLYMKDGKLTADGRGVTLQFFPVSPTEFHAVDSPGDMTLKFEKQGNDKHTRLLIYEGNRPQVFEEAHLVAPTAEQLSVYAGDYYSPELGVTYKIALEDGKLHLRHENRYKDFSKNVLEPKYSAQGTPVLDAFVISGGRDTININFIRTEQNRPHAFAMSAGRIRNIVCARK